MQELILVTLTILAFTFLGMQFIIKKWPVPFISFILFIFIGFGAANTQNVFCAEIIGVFQCMTNSLFNSETIWLAGIFALLSIILTVFRYISNPKEVEQNS